MYSSRAADGHSCCCRHWPYVFRVPGVLLQVGKTPLTLNLPVCPLPPAIASACSAAAQPSQPLQDDKGLFTQIMGLLAGADFMHASALILCTASD